MIPSPVAVELGVTLRAMTFASATLVPNRRLALSRFWCLGAPRG